MGIPWDLVKGIAISFFSIEQPAHDIFFLQRDLEIVD
jgi:hypothetical protein